jgi:hypothetical protein
MVPQNNDKGEIAMFALQRLSASAAVVGFLLSLTALNDARAQASSAGDRPVVVSVTLAGAQTNVPVAAGVNRVEVVGAPGIFCTAGDAPDFRALLTAMVAGTPAMSGYSPQDLLNVARRDGSRIDRLDQVFGGGAFRNPSGNGHGLAEVVPGQSIVGRRDLTLAELIQLRSGQQVQLPAEPILSVKACYTAEQIDAVLAEAARVLLMAVTGDGTKPAAKPPAQ